MPTISVTIDDKTYKMACRAGQEEHLRALVGRFEAYILHLKSNFGSIGDHRLSIMAGILVLDEMAALQEKYNALDQKYRALQNAYQETKSALEENAKAQKKRASYAEKKAELDQKTEEALAAVLEQVAHKVENLARTLLAEDSKDT